MKREIEEKKKKSKTIKRNDKATNKIFLFEKA